jgi:peptidoglycan hydrolase-like protein with peptidoglycan-binding domain
VPQYRRRFISLVMSFLACALPATALAAPAGRLGARTLRPGASGPDVRELQQDLGKVGIAVTADGTFGATTTAAVRTFQRAALLPASGIVGRQTIARLLRATRPSSANIAGGFGRASAAERDQSLGDRIPVSEGMSGHDVRVLQDFLHRAGFRSTVDGQFGTATVRAVRAFESAQHRKVDGVIDAGDIDTLRTLVGAQPEPTDPQSAAPAPLAPGDRATIGPDGLALAPASAPDAVKAIIAAGNVIAKKPYVYGGGHGSWNASGYDCSGSVSYALHGAGLLDHPFASYDFYRWGQSGPGQWVTLYANDGHVYMIVAGLRFDTSGRRQDGTRWHATMRPTTGYTVRHPDGL